MRFNLHSPASLRTAQATRADKPGLERLVDAARWRHLHLDWFDPLVLVEESPFLKLMNGRTILACLGCPPEFPQRSWIRVFAASQAVGLDRAWEHLWPATMLASRENGLRTLDVLLSSSWIGGLVRSAGFEPTDEVVFLEQDNIQPTRAPDPMGGIRRVAPEDLPGIAALDAKAFPEPWRISGRSLEAACSSAAYASLFAHDGELLGYQITSLSPYSAHLSRLAVSPSVSRRGLGTALTVDAMRTLSQQGARRWTVNTQASNKPALALYRKIGFRETGVRYPMATRQL